MARPIGEELARNPTAISRPKGGWFARIWTQRAESAAGNPTVEKIHLGRADPFTLWIAPRTESRLEPCPDAEISTIPSMAFTLWVTQQKQASVPAEAPLEGDIVDQVIAPLPAGVFDQPAVDEPVSSEGGQEDNQRIQPAGNPVPAILTSHAFTVWTTPQALASPVILTVSAGRGHPSGNTREDKAEQGPSIKGDVAEKSSMGVIVRLGALAAMILLLIAAMFVIASKDKEIGDLNHNAGLAKKKINELKHDKGELKGLLLKEHGRSGDLAKELGILKTDFKAAKEQYAKESADLQAQGDQLALNLKEVRAMLEESKKAFVQEQSTRVQVERDRKALIVDLEEATRRTAGMMKKVEDNQRLLAALGEREDLMKKEMSATSKALEDAREQMAAGKMQLQQSEKQAARLAAEVQKLKAVIDDLKSKPDQPPKPAPRENPVPEVEPKAVPKDKPDKGPINV